MFSPFQSRGLRPERRQDRKVDLGSVRDTLLYIQSDAAATPGMERLSETLAVAIAEINRIESVSPASEPQIISSRFLPARL